MKKFAHLFVATGIVLALAACGDEDQASKEQETTEQAEVEESESAVVKQEQVASLVDPRLQEPTEESICEMCNMKVYTKEHEMGVFSAQAIKADGSIAFYDDIGCLLNAEFANVEVNEKFVRDYNTLNWFNVEQAYIVKTTLKSPMNWGYIFFKYEDDADKYIAENEGSELTSYTKVRQEALERRKAKMNATNTTVDMNSEGAEHQQGKESQEDSSNRE